MIYDAKTIKRYNYDQNSYHDLITGQKFAKSDVIEVKFGTIQNKKSNSPLPVSSDTEDIKMNYTAEQILTKTAVNKNMVGYDAKPSAIDNSLLARNDVENVKRWKKLKKLKLKGYCLINTKNYQLNVELHFDLAPAACELFCSLISKDFIDVSVNSAFNGSALILTQADKKDLKMLNENISEVKPGDLLLTNTGLQLLSLKLTNDIGKHVIFGRVVGGKENLSRLSKKKKILIKEIKILVNPIQILAEKEKDKLLSEAQEALEYDELLIIEKEKKERSELQNSDIIGKYMINLPNSTVSGVIPVRKPRVREVKQNVSFSSW